MLKKESKENSYDTEKEKLIQDDTRNTTDEKRISNLIAEYYKIVSIDESSNYFEKIIDELNNLIEKPQKNQSFIIEDPLNPGSKKNILHFLMEEFDDSCEIKLIVENTINKILEIEGEHIRFTDWELNTPLHVAIPINFIDTLNKILIKAPEMINARNAFGDTPINLAMQYTNIPIVGLLLAHGANTDIPNKSGKTAADYLGDTSYKFFVQSRNFDETYQKMKSVPDKELRQALNAMGHYFCSWVLEKIISKYEMSFWNKQKPLTMAYLSKNNDIYFNDFVDDGLNLQDSEGLTLLHKAVISPNPNYQHIGMLIARGARTDILDTKGNTIADYFNGDKNCEKFVKCTNFDQIFELMNSMPDEELKNALGKLGKEYVVWISTQRNSNGETLFCNNWIYNKNQTCSHIIDSIPKNVLNNEFRSCDSETGAIAFHWLLYSCNKEIIKKVIPLIEDHTLNFIMGSKAKNGDTAMCLLLADDRLAEEAVAVLNRVKEVPGLIDSTMQMENPNYQNLSPFAQSIFSNNYDFFGLMLKNLKDDTIKLLMGKRINVIGVGKHTPLYLLLGDKDNKKILILKNSVSANLIKEMVEWDFTLDEKKKNRLEGIGARKNRVEGNEAQINMVERNGAQTNSAERNEAQINMVERNGAQTNRLERNDGYSEKGCNIIKALRNLCFGTNSRSEGRPREM